MDSSQLTPEQVARLRVTVGRQLRYLNRLCERMQQVGLPVDDPLWRQSIAARNAMQDLYMTAHYCRCGSGVGRA